MFLAPDDLADLTGYTRPTSQIQWLTERGYPFEIGADRRPKVLKSYIESRLGGRKARQKPRPKVHLPHGKTTGKQQASTTSVLL